MCFIYRSHKLSITNVRQQVNGLNSPGISIQWKTTWQKKNNSNMGVSQNLQPEGKDPDIKKYTLDSTQLNS